MAKDNKMDSHEPVATVREVSEESPQTLDVERLGRQRPADFSSTWLEVAFVVSLLGSLAMAVSLCVSSSLPLGRLILSSFFFLSLARQPSLSLFFASPHPYSQLGRNSLLTSLSLDVLFTVSLSLTRMETQGFHHRWLSSCLTGSD